MALRVPRSPSCLLLFTTGSSRVASRVTVTLTKPSPIPSMRQRRQPQAYLSPCFDGHPTPSSSHNALAIGRHGQRSIVAPWPRTRDSLDCCDISSQRNEGVLNVRQTRGGLCLTFLVRA